MRERHESWMSKSARAHWAMLPAYAGRPLAFGARAQDAATDDTDKPAFPTTVFAEDAKTATVTAAGITATINMVARPDLDPDNDTPMLNIVVDGKQVLEAPGPAGDVDEPSAEASIAEAWSNTSSSGVPMRTSADITLRSWAMSAAALIPWPATSPTTRVSASPTVMPSYQSPPICRLERAGW